MTTKSADPRRFPDGFVWGTATSAYQVEGAAGEDGRGPSIWDAFTRTPGTIDDGSTGDVAIDHYHRYRDDVRLLKAMGTKAYRFSVAWPRVFPDGAGAPNPKGLVLYDRLVDELLANGIEPYATLYHWDLPQALQERVGGWQSRDTPLAFADYAGYVAEKLSDRVKNFFTINEFYSFVEFGYGSGVNAPGLKLPPAQLKQVRHHAVLGHGLATQAIRARAKLGTRVGPVDNLTVAVPAIETEEHIRAAEMATRVLNAPYLTVILEGRYPDAYLSAAGPAAPKFTEQELQAIATPVDFVGINVYLPNQYVLAADTPPGYRLIPFNKSHPRMAAPWHLVGPEALYWGPRHLARVWGVNDVYVTENGCAADDHVAPDGKVYDTDRVMFLRNYLAQLQRATAEGVPVRGYFLWSAFDNFEWANGYLLRFGLIHVDYATQRRTPKLSAAFYREVIARNAVV
jgi:beta-glucosidase